MKLYLVYFLVQSAVIMTMASASLLMINYIQRTEWLWSRYLFLNFGTPSTCIFSNSVTRYFKFSIRSPCPATAYSACRYS